MPSAGDCNRAPQRARHPLIFYPLPPRVSGAFLFSLGPVGPALKPAKLAENFLKPKNGPKTGSTRAAGALV